MKNSTFMVAYSVINEVVIRVVEDTKKKARALGIPPGSFTSNPPLIIVCGPFSTTRTELLKFRQSERFLDLSLNSNTDFSTGRLFTTAASGESGLCLTVKCSPKMQTSIRNANLFLLHGEALSLGRFGQTSTPGEENILICHHNNLMSTPGLMNLIRDHNMSFRESGVTRNEQKFGALTPRVYELDEEGRWQLS